MFQEQTEIIEKSPFMMDDGNFMSFVEMQFWFSNIRIIRISENNTGSIKTLYIF